VIIIFYYKKSQLFKNEGRGVLILHFKKVSVDTTIYFDGKLFVVVVVVVVVV
jgi:hypothetical protein